MREIPSLRTSTATTWELNSGEQLTRVNAAPVRWKEDGRWHEYDFDLRLRTNRGFTATVEGDTTVSMPLYAGAADADAFTLRYGTHEISSWLDGARRVPATARDTTATYAEVRPGVTMKLRASSEGAKEDLVVADAAADAAFSYRIRLSKGLDARLAGDGSVVAVDEAGNPVFAVPPAIVRDAAGAVSPTPRYRLSRLIDGEYRLEFEVEQEWWRAGDRAWPVVVDPSMTIVSRRDSTRMCLQTFHHESIGAEAGYYNWRDPEECDNPNRQWTTVGGDYDGGDFPDVCTYYQRDAVVTFQSLASALSATNKIDSARLVLTTSNRGPIQAVVGGASVNNYGDLTDPLRWSMIEGNSNGRLAVNVLTFVAAWQANRLASSTGYAQAPVRLMGPSIGNHWLAVLYPAACGIWGPAESVDIATSTHLDSAKRPYLEIVSIPAADGRVVSVSDGDTTARRLPLIAHGPDTVNTVRFQYIAGSRRDWQDVPATALRYVTPVGGSTTVPSSELPVVASTGSAGGVDSRAVIWDLQATPGGDVDGSVHVRAIMDDGGTMSGGGATRAVNLRLDRRNPEQGSSVDIGPGSVDLLTGDFGMTTTDVAIKTMGSELSLDRTFHSRGTRTRDSEMFGPTWSSGISADGGRMPYKSLYNYSEIRPETVRTWYQAPREHRVAVEVDVQPEQNCALPDEEESDGGWTSEPQPPPVCEPSDPDPVTHYGTVVSTEWDYKEDVIRWTYDYAQVELVDGGKITFRRTYNDRGQDSGWVPDAEHPGLSIARSGTGWALVDELGATTTFAPYATGSPVYRPTTYSEPGSSQNTSFEWENVQGALRLVRIRAPMLSSSSTIVRTLRLEWQLLPWTTTARVTAVYQGFYDTSTRTTRERAVASYGYDSRGRLTSVSDPRVSGGLATRYAYDSLDRLVSITEPGRAAWRLTYALLTGDGNPGRLRSVSRVLPGTSTEATQTVLYGVPLTGPDAPMPTDAATLGAWGQSDDPPTDATAVFPASAVPTGATADWSRATIHYLNRRGRAVNVLEPGGALSVTRYDENGNVMRTLSAQNRLRALRAADTRTAAGLLSTVYEYDADGVNQRSATGPLHEVKLRETGELVQARTQTLTEYDDDSPNPNLVTSRTHHLLYLASDDRWHTGDAVTTEYNYDGGNDRGWDVGKPTSVVVSPAGVNAQTTTMSYDPTYPLLRTRQAPTTAPGASASLQRFYYYGVDTVAPSPCAALPASEHSAWAGMTCATTTSVVGSDAEVPTVYYRYDDDFNATSIRHANSGGTVREVTFRYDSAGRVVEESITGGGATVPVATTSYNATSGMPVRVSAGGASIEQTFDDHGRIVSYTDATGAVTSYRYDVDGRPAEITDGTGTRRVEYDARGLPVRISDSTLAGPIAAEYDADGNLVRETLPNGLERNVTYDENGDATDLAIVKTACSTDCVWVEQHLTLDLLGRWTDEDNGPGRRSRSLRYDRLNRVVSAQDRSDAGACVTRTYSYDAHSNRSARSTYPAGAGGACSVATAPTTQGLTYDSADRALTSGVGRFSYDVLGRTTHVPGSAIGDALDATYYADSLVSTLEQDGVRESYSYDPLRRPLRRDQSGTGSGSSTDHYADNGDSPVWTTTGVAAWQRHVAGFSGSIATVDQTGSATYHLTDLHGNVVAEASGSLTATAPISRASHDEFGNRLTGAATRYGWLGGAMRSGLAVEGAMQMGDRTYVPELGRFLEVDPVVGASVNAYDYGAQDPANVSDLSGRNYDERRYNSHYDARVSVFAIPSGKYILTAAMRVDMTILGRAVLIDYTVRRKRGIGRISGVRMECRQERIGPDKSCGERKGGKNRGYTLLTNARYHFDFFFSVTTTTRLYGNTVRHSPDLVCEGDRDDHCWFDR
ncbi:MAG TPA: RHS repeat-associated core domain-containing protein [Conexibacter sp.]|nr:RHS repeat-associated core domain-containing protein [Conexibacter sp.]